MFESVKLNKNMYKIDGKSFLDVLEENDPSENYKNTPMENTDAFERQLKRFDIRTSGAFCDRVEKFFKTTESAVLFPEFIRRSIKKGFDDSPLEEISAAYTNIDSNSYTGCTMNDTATYSTSEPMTAMPESTISESETITKLKKYGRVINSSYEAIRQQRLDVLTCMLRNVGLKLGELMFKDAVNTLVTGSQTIAAATSDISYSDITKLYGKFNTYKMNCIIVSPANTAKILAFSQLMETRSGTLGEIVLPFGTKMITSNQIGDDKILGIDSSFALEVINSSEIILETDKIIDRQLDQIAVSINAGFKKIFDNASVVLTIA